MTGVRVLDLARVVAGPVATRSLAVWGADVRRVDAPHLDEPQWQYLDTGAGKRSTLLDLTDRRDRDVLDELLAGGDVLVTGDPPTAFDAFDAFDLPRPSTQAAAPGLVVGRLSAWGTTGPGAVRRGFDSMVRAATGIAVVEADGALAAGAPPAQVWDHSAGYLLAAGVLTALRHRSTTDTGATVDVSPARITQEQLEHPVRDVRSPGTDLEVTTATVDAPAAALTCAPPAVHHSGGPTTWPAPSRPWGKDPATWRA